ncbi:MAG: hypothetical protein JWM64_2237 [Frankiales bacterium]|nr:hypothetical protein [Frankiales bacterium]
MRVAAMFFAESADHTTDRLRVQGGLWDGLTATAFPASHEIPVVVLLRPALEDVGQSFHLDFHVTGPDGPAGHQHVDVAVNVHKAQTAVVVPVTGTFPTPGRYTLQLRSHVGTDEVAFEVTGPGSSPVARAVEGYALGLQDRP